VGYGAEWRAGHSCKMHERERGVKDNSYQESSHPKLNLGWDDTWGI